MTESPNRRGRPSTPGPLRLLEALVLGRIARFGASVGTFFLICIGMVVGTATWFAIFILAGLILVVFGLDRGASVAGEVVAVTGFFGGLAVAVIVLIRFVRLARPVTRRIDELDRFSFLDGPAPEAPSTLPPKARIGSAELRAIDARLAAPSRNEAPSTALDPAVGEALDADLDS